ncbi:activator of HSP90 ATPase [Brevibacillus sp. NSP2.1]|uniref:activator of HSP90 ATPase n=1 Tax=Brevibacillus sp. NSP2.1 TaxID=3003229 RepID=UPI000414EFE6|nr:activator of HSP90 ATPase [Brevibacillus sp. NSP2.1]
MFTFALPQFSDTQERIAVVLASVEGGCEMTFSQAIVVPHENGWTTEAVEKAEREYYEGLEHGGSRMLAGLQQSANILSSVAVYLEKKKKPACESLATPPFGRQAGMDTVL